MDTSTDNIRSIARRLVDELEKADMRSDVAVKTVKKLNKGELLMLNEAVDGDLERLALDIFLRDGVILNNDGHVQVLVVYNDSEDLLQNFHLLPHLAAVLIPDDEEDRDNRLRLVGRAPKLEAVYLYDSTIATPTISGLQFMYDTEEYINNDGSDIRYERIIFPDFSEYQY